MSRETDSPSSGPQGRGSAAYPSGTPPYGTPLAPDTEADDSRQAPAAPQERKTETTLTTRVRINIPGSRPIPPVVMRTPVSETADAPGAQEAEPEPAPEPEPPVQERTSDWFAPRRPATPRGTPAGASRGTPAAPRAERPAAPGEGSPYPPGHGEDTGSFDATGPLAPGPLGASGDGAEGPGGPRPDDPFATTGRGAAHQHPGDGDYFTDQAPTGGPTGPTSGPAAGDSALTAGPPRAGGRVPTPPGLSDDTAVLTPQKPAHDGEGPGEHVSGHTLTSGIPVVPPATPFPPRDGDRGPGEPRLPQPVQRDVPEARPPKKKGRSKPALLAVAVIAVCGVAYGAGLVMGHADVPKGTTVLGVDIGGSTRDEAVKKLDAAFGDRTGAPLQLSVDGDRATLRPDQAGLTLDTDATARAAATSDYNPVTVIGSLFGRRRAVEPVMPVDEEKLRSALEHAAGAAGSATEGTIRFVPGKAVPVYGKTGKGIDVGASSTAVEDAYREQIATGHPGPVRVALTTREPTVTKAEVDRMMSAFARPAMSGLVTIKAGNASIPFGPEKSLPQILGVKAVDGHLVDTYDKAALKRLYGATFDGVLITRGTGKKTPVQPEDVASALRRALLGKTPAERVAVIDTDPS